MKTPKEFDYDLWTTDEGKCFVRVKLSGEVSEVSPEVMRLLRAEEKRLRREITPVHSKAELGERALQAYEIKHPLSIDAGCFLDANSDTSAELMSAINCNQFILSLTAHQREVLMLCMLGGMKKSQYARSRGVSPASVTKTIRQIQSAAKKYFQAGLKNGE